MYNQMITDGYRCPNCGVLVSVYAEGCADDCLCSAIPEVVSLALSIARIQRGENHLQDAATLRRKFAAECVELAEAGSLIFDEIPDIFYYALCLAAQGDNSALLQVVGDILPHYGVTALQARAACLAKYRLRAAGNPKNFEKERAAVLAAIGKEP
jgi:hypothetical protein